MKQTEKVIRNVIQKVLYDYSNQRGEGILIHYSRFGEIILENTIVKRKVLIRNRYKTLVNVHAGDIDFEKVNKLENPQNAHTLTAEYNFLIWNFTNGVALVEWTLYPDGRFFEDENGFGGESCNETTIFGYIDTLGNVLIPFQNMNMEEKVQFRIDAEEKVQSRNPLYNYSI